MTPHEAYSQVREMGNIVGDGQAKARARQRAREQAVRNANTEAHGATTPKPLPSLTLENYEEFIAAIADNWTKFFADNGFGKKNDFLKTLGDIGSEGPNNINTMIRKQLEESNSQTLLGFKFNLIHIVENIILGMTPEPRNLLREIEYYLLLLGLHDYPHGL